MSQTIALPTNNLLSRSTKLLSSSRRILFHTPAKVTPQLHHYPKTNSQKIWVSNENQKDLWLKRAQTFVQLTPKIIIDKTSWNVIVETGQGCLMEFLKKVKHQYRTQQLIRVLTCIESLGKNYGYFYIDKHMMKISKEKEPLIWIHHNFRFNFREFPISQSSFTKKIFYDNTKRVFSSIVEFPTGFSVLPELIEYLKKFSENLNWKNVDNQCISRNSYSTTQNGKVYSNLSNSPSGTTIKDRTQMKSIKSSEMIRQKSVKKNNVKKIQIKDHHPEFFQNSVRKIVSIKNGSESSYTQSKGTKMQAFELTDSIGSSNYKQIISLYNQSSVFPAGKSVTLSPTIVKKENYLKTNCLTSSTKPRKHSANTEFIKQWIPANIYKKFPHSTFSASTRALIQEQIAQSNTPSSPKTQNQPLKMSFGKQEKAEDKSIPSEKLQQKKESNKKWVDNYGGSNKIAWGINSQITEEEDSILGDEVDKLFQSKNSQEHSHQYEFLKVSELTKQFEHLFESGRKSENPDLKNEEYFEEFQNVLI